MTKKHNYLKTNDYAALEGNEKDYQDSRRATKDVIKITRNNFKNQ